MVNPINVETSIIREGYVRISASGNAGIGSAGNQHGNQIREAIANVIANSSPLGILIDFRQLDYAFGNYICMAVFGKGFPRNRMCILASGKTLIALRDLWDLSRFEKLMPIFDDESLALAYITR